MKVEALPIYKSALELAVYMEQIVRGFEKYHKYTTGIDLRTRSKAILFGINRIPKTGVIHETNPFDYDRA